MGSRLLTSFFILSTSFIYATITGNPAEPGMLKKGLWKKSQPWWSIRVGYYDDWIYKYRFCDEFKLEGETHTRTHLQFSTYAGTFTLNFLNHLDFYTILGSSRMQLDEEIYSKRAFSWGIGTKILFLKRGNFFFGGDTKYFQSDQKPRFFLIDGEPYNIKTDYRSKYDEWQASVGIAYRIKFFVPYINANYIFTRIEPLPPMILVRLPDMDELVDVELKSIISKKKWGMALGFSLVDIKKIELSLEWRAFNQNAINVNGQIRF